MHYCTADGNMRTIEAQYHWAVDRFGLNAWRCDQAPMQIVENGNLILRPYRPREHDHIPRSYTFSFQVQADAEAFKAEFPVMLLHQNPGFVSYLVASAA